MRILQVLLDPRIGGAEAVAETLDSEWGRSGLQCKIVYLDPVAYSRTSRASRLFRLRRAIKEFGPDVILSHTELPSLYARLCAPLDIPVVIVLHSGISYIVITKQRYLEKLLLLRTSSVIAVGESQKLAYIKATGWSGTIHVVPNPIRSDISFRRMRWKKGRRALVGNVARVVDSKDPGFWYSAAMGAIAVDTELDFCWWGPVGQSDACAALVSEVGSRGDSRIRFAGPTEDVPSVLDRMDVFFSPSKWEAFGLALHEAVLAGVPVVCTTDVGAIIDSRVKCFEYKAGDLHGAIAAIQRALQADQRALERGSSIVAQEFSPTAISQRYIDILTRERSY